MYRIGLSDQAAEQATYNLATPQDMIRAAAGQMLARLFRAFTPCWMSWARTGRASSALPAGIAVSNCPRFQPASKCSCCGGSHSPAARGGSAYQGVQTAAIRSVLRIAEAKAEATETMNSAQSAATTLRTMRLPLRPNEWVLPGRSWRYSLGPSRPIASVAPHSLFERRLQRFNQVLARTRFTVVDHRIEKTSAPLLDLRPQSFSADTARWRLTIDRLAFA